LLGDREREHLERRRAEDRLQLRGGLFVREVRLEPLGDAGGKDCGAITAVLHYYGVPEKLFKVSAGNFIPAPKVDSSVVRIRLYEDKPVKPQNEAIFFRTIRAAFEQRRKTLPNSLSAVFGELTKEELTAAVLACGHSADIRGERLSVEEFAALSDELWNRIESKKA
ncbi:MAG: hypothetical protein IKA76_07695, partial [Clostridia bacterium]|nr:hypothetical protein [Clostridia bacterium]